MAIAMTLQEYLDQRGIEYDVVSHRPTATSMETAEESRISGDKIAKSVILGDDSGYVMAVLPATHHVEIRHLSRQLNRQLELITEQELENLFLDCEIGAIPPIGEAYKMEVVFDDCLKDCNEVYFEAGTHRDLVHLRGDDFRDLMHSAKHGYFSHRSF